MGKSATLLRRIAKRAGVPDAPGYLRPGGDRLTYTDPASGVHSFDDDLGVIWYTVSTPAQDRDGDVVRPGAFADLSNYRRNPVWLYNHGEEDSRPVGTAEHPETGELLVRQEGDSFLAGCCFDREGEWGREIYRLARAGLLRAASPGFIPRKAARLSRRTWDAPGGKSGWDITDADLLEISVTPTPANPEAIRLSLAGGDLSPVMRKSLVKALGTVSAAAGGALTGFPGTRKAAGIDVQAYRFPRAAFPTRDDAAAWLELNGHDAARLEEDADGWRLALFPEGELVEGTARDKAGDGGVVERIGQRRLAGPPPGAPSATLVKYRRLLMDAGIGDSTGTDEDSAMADQQTLFEADGGGEGGLIDETADASLAEKIPLGAEALKNYVQHLRELLRYGAELEPLLEQEDVKALLLEEMAGVVQEAIDRCLEVGGAAYPGIDLDGEGGEDAAEEEPPPPDEEEEGSEEEETPQASGEEPGEAAGEGLAEDMDDEDQEENADRYAKMADYRRKAAARALAVRKAARLNAGRRAVCKAAADWMDKISDHEETPAWQSHGHKGHAGALRKMVEPAGPDEQQDDELEAVAKAAAPAVEKLAARLDKLARRMGA